MREKSDPVLGLKVQNHLIASGYETPMDSHPLLTDQQKKTIIEQNFTGIMRALGLDLNDDSLMETPKRVAKMYVDEIFYGLNYDNFPKCTKIKNSMGAGAHNHSFVLERNVNIQSNCEHHFVVIDGKATIAYIPDQWVLGLSKLNRIAAFFAKRPTVQERLTEQICEAISFIAETQDVAVYVDAVHYCVKSRGVEDVGSSTVTLATRGIFSEPNSEVRREFLNLARMP